MFAKTISFIILLSVYTVSNTVLSLVPSEDFVGLLTGRLQKRSVTQQKISTPDSLKRSVSKYILKDWETYRKKLLDCPLPENSLDFEGLPISGKDFSGISLRGANFNKCILENVNFTGADLTDTTFEDTLFKEKIILKDTILYKDLNQEFKFNDFASHIDFIAYYSQLINLGEKRKAAGLNKVLGPMQLKLSDYIFHELNLIGINLQNANIKGMWLNDSNLSHANFTHAKLIDVDLQGSNLTEACLYGADLSRTNLNNVRLYEKITLVQSGSNPLSVKETGRAVFYEWADALKKGDQERVYVFQRLINAQVPVFKSIPHQDFLKFDWKNRDFSNANFIGINLMNLDFTGTNLEKADLRDANIKNMILKNTNINETIF